MKIYVYFVSYAHTTGWGNIEITQDMEMKEFEFIRRVEEVIKDEGDCKDPIVVNYQLLRIEDS